eukprot:scaffold36814_cov65-Cyclotella_meneghiniana.AAC.1
MIAERSRETAKDALDLLVNSNNGIDAAVTNTAITAPIADTPAVSVAAPIAANPPAIIATTKADTPIAPITIPIAPTPAAIITDKITTTSPATITIPTGALKDDEASTAAVATQAAMTSPITQATKTAASIASPVVSPVHEFTLRVGDVIRCQHVMDNDDYAEVTVREISLGNTIGDGLYVWTTSIMHTVGYVHRQSITLIHSIHDDAPPLGEMIEIDDINLEPGALPKATLQELKENLRKSIDNLPGGTETMAMATAVDNARKTMLSPTGGAADTTSEHLTDWVDIDNEVGGAAGMISEHLTDWVVFHPIKLSDDDAIIVDQFQSDWLSVFCKSTDIVTLQELTQAKLGEEFAVVDRIDPVQDQEWRRVILRKIRKAGWQVISETGDSILDTIGEVGEKGLLSGWDDTYRPPLKQHYDEAFVQARKRQVDCLEDEEELDVTPRRKKRRDANVSAVSLQARTMKRDATFVEGAVQFKVGDVVQYNLANVDCTKGKSANKCGCKSGKCNTNKCKCKQADRRCNSSCHGGQSNNNCTNCIDEPFDLSMCHEIDG